MHQKVQVLALAKLAMHNHFIEAQRAADGYQTTGQARFVRTYRLEKADFWIAQANLRRLASGSELAEAAAEGRAAAAAFTAYDRALAAPVRSGAATLLYARAGTFSDALLAQNGRLRQLLASEGNALTAKSEHILGVGLGWTAVVLAFGLMVPVIAGAVGLRWVSGPLHRATTTVRRRALGDMRVRALVGGPADVRELARSINFLADKSDRTRAAEDERTHLLAEVRLAAIRIRGHLRRQRVIKEAVIAVQEHLDADFVWVGLVSEAEAAESLSGDIGRGLEQARLYEGEERIIEELKAVDRAKDSFIAAASHDLRTPLTSIIGYVELLSDGEAGLVLPQQSRMLDAVDRNARRLKTLIEDVLTTSKIELGAFTSQLRPLDLAAVAWAAVDVVRPSAGAGGLSFEVVCPDKGLMVDGDTGQLDRVLVNLLSNAVKYTPRGGSVSLTLACTGGFAVLTVSDTGIGIPEQDQASLFTRFFRASNAVDRALPGSGLGLSIVRTIVANHHGDIGLTSAEGEGTAVTVRIPLHRP